MHTLGKIIILGGLSMGALSACQTTDTGQLMGKAAEEMENKVVGKWEGNWNGNRPSTVTFSKNADGGLNALYCFETMTACRDLPAHVFVDNTVRMSSFSAKWVYSLKSPDILHGEFRSNNGMASIDMTRAQ